MSFSAIWHRRLRYMLTPQWDLYQRIRDRFCVEATYSAGPILDYGCGIGFGSIQLIQHADQEGCEVYGVDNDPEAITFAEQNLGRLVTFTLADAIGEGIALENWDGRPKDFGVVTLIEVIEHMENGKQQALIRELSACVREEGVLVLSTPNKRSQFRKHSGHVGIHDPQSLRGLLSPHFSSVSFEDYLGEPVADDSTVSPLVAICREPK